MGNSHSSEVLNFVSQSNSTFNDTINLPFGNDTDEAQPNDTEDMPPEAHDPGKPWVIHGNAARCVPHPHFADSCSGAWNSGSGIFARNVTDSTGRILIETKHYSFARFHNGAWVGMAILAAILLILSALLAGLTLGVCGLDATLLQLRCVTGTPRERYVGNLSCKEKRILTSGQETSTYGRWYEASSYLDAL
jgi:hypothetical protein